MIFPLVWGTGRQSEYPGSCDSALTWSKAKGQNWKTSYQGGSPTQLTPHMGTEVCEKLDALQLPDAPSLLLRVRSAIGKVLVHTHLYYGTHRRNKNLLCLHGSFSSSNSWCLILDSQFGQINSTTLKPKYLVSISIYG